MLVWYHPDKVDIITVSMNNISKIRSIIQVFHQYGISLFGERKFDNLYHDLRMEPVFVMGLIFELELVTQVYLTDEEAYAFQKPIQIISKLL